MIQTAVHLINGKIDVASYYSKAKGGWDEIRQSEAYKSVEDLAELLARVEPLFVNLCGGKRLGEEIFVAVAFGQFYDELIGLDGSIQEVLRIRKAFELSLSGRGKRECRSNL